MCNANNHRWDCQCGFRISGRWMRHDDAWHLVTTGFSTRSFPDGEQIRRRVCRLPDSPECHFCARKIRSSAPWGFDPSGHLECRPCSTARASMGARQFLALCRRIAGVHAR